MKLLEDQKMNDSKIVQLRNQVKEFLSKSSATSSFPKQPKNIDSSSIDEAWEVSGEFSAFLLGEVKYSKGHLTKRILKNSEYIGYLNRTKRIKNDKWENRISSLTCVDEGAPVSLIRMAGGGIGALVSNDAFIKLASYIRKLPEDVYILPHEGCGAVSFFASKVLGLTGLSDIELNALSTYLASRLVDKLLADGVTNVSLGDRVLQGELRRPAYFHDSIALVFDLSSRLQPTYFEMLPQSFKITSRNLDYNIKSGNDALLSGMIGQIHLSIGIAFGEHGFGPDRFSANAPFFIFIINSDETKKDAMAFKDELNRSLESFLYKDKIKTLLIPDSIF